MFTALEFAEGELANRLLHGVYGIAATGQHRQLHQLVKGFIQGLVNLPVALVGPGEQLLYRHLVLGEGAGFVHR